MSVHREVWGATQDGVPGYLFHCSAGRTRARFSNFGATLVSLEMPDRHGELADVVLGFDSLLEYDSPRNPYFGGVVGRCANRIAGARFLLDEREVTLTANEGRNHLHGGRRGFNRRAWTWWDAAPLSFELVSPDGEEGYPGALALSAFYLFQEAELMLTLSATCDAPTVFNPAEHSYFNLAGSGTILEHELQVFASSYVVVDDELLPTGVLAEVAGTPFDFRGPRRIGERIDALESSAMRGYDLCYVLDHRPGIGPACRLRDPHSGRVLELRTSSPGLQLYTGNHLDGIAGKSGLRYPRFGGVCLETQHFPDAVHHAAFPSVVLRPGEVRRTTTLWSLSVE